MKLIICYTVFNGLELLEKSIKSIYDHVDVVLIGYQTTSNKFNVDESVADFVSYIAKKYPKVKLYYYKPNKLLQTKEQERVKHTELLREAKKLGATHYILSACDHFYTKEHVEYGKQLTKDLDFDVSLTMMRTYYKHPTWQMSPMETYYMPFICKMYPSTKYIKGKYPVKVDPSVIVNTSKNLFIFQPASCILHHYSMIREDIENKFMNAAASVRWSEGKISKFIYEYQNAKLGDEISYFQGRKIIEVPNLFNI